MPQLDFPLNELKLYTGSSPKPYGFESYWDKALSELDDSGLDYTIEESEFSAPGVLCKYLYFTGVGGAKVCCKFLRPESISGKIPGVAMFHGYSGKSGGWVSMLPYAYAGFVVLALDVRGQMGKSEDNLCVPGNTFSGHIIRGLSSGDPEKLFFRNVFLDTAKTARILMSMDFVDENKVGASGGSQGGALAIACGALEPRVSKIVSVFPFLSDYKRSWEMDLWKSAYEELSNYVRNLDPRHESFDKTLELLGFIDVSNLAPRIKGETYMFLSLMDELCPPSTQFAVYNRITAEKSCEIYPNHGHEGLPDSDELIFKFFMQYK